MFVHAKRRFKDGKEHRYWSVVENCRNRDGRVVQRQVLYLGEINDSQRAAWCRSIEVLQGDYGPAPMALFPMNREAPELHVGSCGKAPINGEHKMWGLTSRNAVSGGCVGSPGGPERSGGVAKRLDATQPSDTQSD